MGKLEASSSPGLFSSFQSSRYKPSAIGLCLAGGGYRAALFHAGGIVRLNELGLLGRIDRISTVSGGSIMAAFLALAWKHFDIDRDTGKVKAQSLKTHFIDNVRAATARTIDVRVPLDGVLPFTSAGNRLAELYNRLFFDGAPLRDLPVRPRFVFSATNIETGGLVRFTRNYIADWRALFATTDEVRLADAVAASSAFPPSLAPLRLDLSGETVVTPEGARFKDPQLHQKPVLIDGGVYDNLALESVWKRCGVVLASYAGHNADAEVDDFTIDHQLPMVHTFLASSIDQRERLLAALYQNILDDGLPERAGAYWTARSALGDYPKNDGWWPGEDTMKRAQRTPTRFEALSSSEQQDVILAGYTHADRALRSYVVDDAMAPSVAPTILLD